MLPAPLTLVALTSTSPALVSVVLKLALSATAPPYKEIGPPTAMLLLTVTLALVVLVDLPRISPPRSLTLRILSAENEPLASQSLRVPVVSSVASEPLQVNAEAKASL